LAGQAGSLDDDAAALRIPLGRHALCRSLSRQVRGFRQGALANDGNAAALVTVLCVPQSHSYALLARLPSVTRAMASRLPIVACAMFG
jgi:hypothetical protein